MDRRLRKPGRPTACCAPAPTTRVSTLAWKARAAWNGRHGFGFVEAGPSSARPGSHPTLVPSRQNPTKPLLRNPRSASVRTVGNLVDPGAPDTLRHPGPSGCGKGWPQFRVAGNEGAHRLQVCPMDRTQLPEGCPANLKGRTVDVMAPGGDGHATRWDTGPVPIGVEKPRTTGRRHHALPQGTHVRHRASMGTADPEAAVAIGAGSAPRPDGTPAQPGAQSAGSGPPDKANNRKPVGMVQAPGAEDGADPPRLRASDGLRPDPGQRDCNGADHRCPWAFRSSPCLRPASERAEGPAIRSEPDLAVYFGERAWLVAVQRAVRLGNLSRWAGSLELFRQLMLITFCPERLERQGRMLSGSGAPCRLPDHPHPLKVGRLGNVNSCPLDAAGCHCRWCWSRRHRDECGSREREGTQPVGSSAPWAEEHGVQGATQAGNPPRRGPGVEVRVRRSGSQGQRIPSSCDVAEPPVLG